MAIYEAGSYDVIVVGAGHAGIEAGLASARMGAKTLMLTLNLESIGFMPCNPSVGGPAKGTVVREIDALGGEMAKNIDKTNIQMRLLNTAKGPAVHALRAQADKVLYQQEMKRTLENEPNLTLQQGMVEELVIDEGVCRGVITKTKACFRAETVVVTTGTYLRGKIIIGDLEYDSGPNNMQPSVNLSYHLQDLGFDLVRFKTGTPPRVNGNTVDYDETEMQPGDTEDRAFSYETTTFNHEQIPCWLTYTEKETHQLISDNLERSPMYSGMIKGTGPRYCPSIEDKIVRFHDKPRHQIFIEPEGKYTNEVYIQGLSSSLPEDVQRDMVRTVPGLKHAQMMRAGYAIEYDALDPTQLWPSLETKRVKNLFTAGQINGTSGYEEAGAQGIMAGINATRKAFAKEPVVLDRSQAYIAVLIDDLVTKGTKEPYRLLTSRAEYRLLLRHDNADLRLTDIGYDVGLIKVQRYQQFRDKQQRIDAEMQRLQQVNIKPTPELQEMLEAVNAGRLKEPVTAAHLLKRPQVSYSDIIAFVPAEEKVPDYVAEQVEIQIKYDGYIQKQWQQVERMKKMDSKLIPEQIDYSQIDGLATEAQQRLTKVRPLSVGQASRVSGVNPSDISILLVYLEQAKSTPQTAAAST